MPEAFTIRRLRFTPMADLIRGRVSGQLDWQSRAAALPLPARALVTRVVRRARLSVTERVGVADELIAHFDDALARGETVETIRLSFGDERLAAKLLGRAVRRNRSLLTKAWRMAVSTSVAIAILAGARIAYFFTGTPALTYEQAQTMYAAELAAPRYDPEWNRYRAAYEALNIPESLPGNIQTDMNKAAWASTPLNWETAPDKPNWPAFVEWFESRAGAIAAIRAVAVQPNQSPTPVYAWGRGNEGFYWREIVHEVLTSDAYLAREVNDGPRLISDIRALLSGPGGNFSSPPLKLANGRSALSQIITTLRERPQLLDDAVLREVAHAFASPHVAADLMEDDTAWWRNQQLNRLRTTYTDDGNGSGRLTAQGALYRWESSSAASPWERFAVRAKVALLMPASRRAVLDEFDRLMTIRATQFARPARLADWSELDAIRESTAKEPTLQQSRYALLTPFPFDRAAADQEMAERFLGFQEGGLIAIGLEMYRREHGEIPTTLDALVPAMLPTLPVDRITGGPLHYRLIDGHPYVYSVGVDRDDDGGRMPADRDGTLQPTRAARWTLPTGQNSIDGDWVLYDGRPRADQPATQPTTSLAPQSASAQ